MAPACSPSTITRCSTTSITAPTTSPYSKTSRNRPHQRPLLHLAHIQRRRGRQRQRFPRAMTRALDMRNGDYGYAIVEVDSEWVHIYNKPLGGAPEAKLAWAIRTGHKPMTRTQAHPNSLRREGFSVEKVWTDSASIFTRVGFDAENIYFGNSPRPGSRRAQIRRLSCVERTDRASLFSRPRSAGQRPRGSARP